MKTTMLLLSFGVMISLLSCSNDTGNEPADAESVNGDLSEIPRLMMQPGNNFFLTPAGYLTEEHQTPEHLDRETVRSFIFVQPTDSLEEVREYERGKIVELSLDEHLQITARIDRNQAMGLRIRNLSATILEPYDGVITLSVDEGQVTGNIDLVSENRLFHLRYDSLSDLHYLAEIDRSKLDVLEGDDPLEID